MSGSFSSLIYLSQLYHFFKTIVRKSSTERSELMEISISGKIPKGYAINGTLVNGIAINGEIEQKKPPNYVKEGLSLHYDAINNTGNGHDNNVSIWTDLSGYGWHGTLSGNPVWSYDRLNFDGVNDLVSSAMTLNLMGNSFTVSTSILISATNNYRGIAGGHNSTPGLNFGQWGSNILSCGVHPHGAVAIPLTDVPLNTGIQFTMKISNGTLIEAYINGQKVGTKTITAFAQLTSSEVFRIGRTYNSADRYLKGDVRNMMVYIQALTDAEILQNYEYDKERFALGQ